MIMIIITTWVLTRNHFQGFRSITNMSRIFILHFYSMFQFLTLFIFYYHYYYYFYHYYSIRNFLYFLFYFSRDPIRDPIRSDPDFVDADKAVKKVIEVEGRIDVLCK